MKRILLLLSTVCCAAVANAQLSNTGFENWSLLPYEETSAYWITSNYITVPEYGEVTVTKVTGQGSPRAIHMETKAVGSDFAPGFITNTIGDIESGEGGQPFSVQATALNGFYRYNLPAQDTAFIIAMFKKNGAIVSSDTLKIKGTGSQLVFMPFSLPLTLSVVPDTVILVAVASNILDGTYAHVQNGSWLELDNLILAGPGAPPVPNGTFEQWLSRSFETPDDWQRTTEMWDGSLESNIKRSTDKHGGTYAAQLITAIDSNIALDAIMPGSLSAFGMLSAAAAVDTLIGYYKYTTTGSDIAAINCTFFKGGLPKGSVDFPLPAVATYTKFALPLVNPVAGGADSVLVEFMSSGYTGGGAPVVPVAGSTLLIDDIDIKAYVVGINDVKKEIAYNIYPNPAKNVLNISLKAQRSEDVHITLTDAKGSIVYTGDNRLTQGTVISIPVSQLAPGMYFYSIKGANGEVKDRFFKD